MAKKKKSVRKQQENPIVPWMYLILGGLAGMAAFFTLLTGIQ